VFATAYWATSAQGGVTRQGVVLTYLLSLVIGRRVNLGVWGMAQASQLGVRGMPTHPPPSMRALTRSAMPALAAVLQRVLAQHLQHRRLLARVLDVVSEPPLCDSPSNSSSSSTLRKS